MWFAGGLARMPAAPSSRPALIALAGKHAGMRNPCAPPDIPLPVPETLLRSARVGDIVPLRDSAEEDAAS